MKLITLILVLTIASCGKVGVDDSKHQLGVEYESVAKFCDDRYGYMTYEAESCFADYRNFFDVQISIKDYCSTTFTNRQDILDCQQNLVDILSSSIGDN
jgi:hypothetical protein